MSKLYKFRIHCHRGCFYSDPETPIDENLNASHIEGQSLALVCHGVD